VLTSLKFLLNTSILALATSAANSSGPAFGVVARASPLNTALAGVLPAAPPFGLSSTTKVAPPFQAAISPGDCDTPIESVATMKMAGLPAGPPTEKALASGLKTWPVGLPPGTGTEKSSETAPPPTPPLYTPARAELLSDTHRGVEGPAASPQALVRAGSTSLGFKEALLAMRLVWAKLFGGGVAAPAGAATASMPATAVTAMLAIPIPRNAYGMRSPFLANPEAGPCRARHSVVRAVVQAGLAMAARTRRSQCQLGAEGYLEAGTGDPTGGTWRCNAAPR